MPVSMYSTREMLKVLRQAKRPKTFFLDTFFKGEQTHKSREVDIDIVRGKRRLAPFVSPRGEGVKFERQGFTTETFKPPYVMPFDALDADDLLDRLPGETLYDSEMGPAQREAYHLGQMLAEFDDAITRREEWMAAMALTTGEIPVVGDGVDHVINVLMDPNHKDVLAGNDLWSDQDNSNPILKLKEYKIKILQDSGLAPDIVVMGEDAIDAFVAHPKVKEEMNLRRVDNGSINPRMLPDGVMYWGYVASVGADIYSYYEWYIDDTDGQEYPMMPSKKILMGSTKARATRHYGVIQDIEAGVQMVGKRYPKSWTTPKPSARWVMLQSSPLPVPHQIDAFLTATVLD